MEFDLSRLWRRGQPIRLRRAALCERVAGTSVLGPWCQELAAPGETLVLERSGRIDGWVSWSVGTLALDFEITQPIEADLPGFTIKPDGETLLLRELVLCRDEDLEGAERLFRAICPRLAIELGVSRVALRLELSDEARGCFSVLGFLMQKIWGIDTRIEDRFDLVVKSQCLPQRFRRAEGGGHEILALWTNPIT